MSTHKPIKISLLAIHNTSPSTLYGLYDVLSSVGRGWETFVTGDSVEPQFDVRIVCSDNQPITCSGDVLVAPHLGVEDDHDADIVLVASLVALASGPPQDFDPRIVAWLHRNQQRGTLISSACTGAILLARAGLLNGIKASSHFAYSDQFRIHFPKIKMRMDQNVCVSGAGNLLVTSGGATAWQELALYLITRYCGIEHAMRTAKFWLIPDRDVNQASFSALCKGIPHNDRAINQCQKWISERPQIENPVAEMTTSSGLPSTTFARRFKKATGFSPIDYVHMLRMEEAKQILETQNDAVDKVGRRVGYEDTSSFRRIFKRIVGLTPGIYRRKFGRGRFEKFVNLG